RARHGHAVHMVDVGRELKRPACRFKRLFEGPTSCFGFGAPGAEAHADWKDETSLCAMSGQPIEQSYAGVEFANGIREPSELAIGIANNELRVATCPHITRFSAGK